MITCANCTSEAKYDYMGIKYCRPHLPRFLVRKDGSIAAKPIVDIATLTATAPKPIQFPTAEEYLAATEPAPTKKRTKAAPKVVEPEVVEEPIEVVEEPAAEEAPIEE